jgi:sugar fermentation stimulation protein A
MRFPDPLVRGTLIKRYKRFLADVRLDDRDDPVTAHCANPGSMMGLATPGATVWLSPSRNPARKLKWSWELVAVPGGLVGVNTAHPNAIAAEAVAEGRIPELAGYERCRREVRYGKNSRIDLLLEGGGHAPCYVEIKSVTLKRGDHAAEFPDAVTARGTKHLEELGDMAESGARAVMLFLAQRDDCRDFTVAGDIDPAYAAALTRAEARGVELICYACRLAPTEIAVDKPLPIRL